MKQFCWVALTLLVACFGFGACSDGSKKARYSVSLIHYFTGSLSAGINELCQSVNLENPGYVLTPTPLEHESFKTAIRIQLEGPNPPDLFSYWAGARTQNLVNRKSVQAISGLFRDRISQSAFSPAIKQALTYNGELYMIPITRHFVGFFYNPKIFRSLGLAEPVTWQDFRTLLTILRQHGIQPLALGALQRWPAQFWFDYLLLRTAGFEYRQRLMTGKAQFTDPEVRSAVQLWQDLSGEGDFNPDAPTQDWDSAAMAVVTGKAAMTLNGTWLIGLYAEKGYQFPADYGFFPFPMINPAVENTALGPIDGILLSAGSAHREDALAVLERLSRPDPQLSFNLAAGGIAPRSDVPIERYPALQREISVVIDRSRHWAFNFDLATPPEQAEIGLNALMDLVRTPRRSAGILSQWERDVRLLWLR